MPESFLHIVERSARHKSPYYNSGTLTMGINLKPSGVRAWSWYGGPDGNAYGTWEWIGLPFATGHKSTWMAKLSWVNSAGVTEEYAFLEGNWTPPFVPSATASAPSTPWFSGRTKGYGVVTSINSSASKYGFGFDWKPKSNWKP